MVVTALSGTFKKKQSSTSEHLLAGRKMPWWSIAISYVMSIFGTVAFVAGPGEAYRYGLRLAVMDWFYLIFAPISFFLFIRFYFKAKAFTPFTYLEKRFDYRVCAILSVTFFLGRALFLAMVLFSLSVVFKSIVGWPTWVTIVIIGITSTIYCTLGGLKAVVWTQVLVFFVLVGVLFATMVTCMLNVKGGAIGVITYAFENDHGFNFSREGFFSFDPHFRLTFWLLMLGSMNGVMLINSTDQIAIQQLLSTKSYKQARNSFLSSMAIGFPLGNILWFIGLAMFAYYAQHPLPEGNPSPDSALFTFVRMKMPQPLPALLAAAMLIASLGTIGGVIIAMSTVMTKDFYLRFIRPTATEEKQVAVSRHLTKFIGIFGIAMALLISYWSTTLAETVMETVYVWMAIISISSPVFLMGVLSTRYNANHALISMLCGFLGILGMAIWYFYSRMTGNPISHVSIGVVGFLTTTACALVVPFFQSKAVSEENLKNLTIWTLSRQPEQ